MTPPVDLRTSTLFAAGYRTHASAFYVARMFALNYQRRFRVYRDRGLWRVGPAVLR